MKLAVVGSRTFSDYDLLKSKLNEIQTASGKITQINSGGAFGADRLAERYAVEYSIPTRIFLPDWNKYGKRAGPLRNEEIIKCSDKVVAFWDGKSPGTLSSINLAKKYNIDPQIVLF